MKIKSRRQLILSLPNKIDPDNDEIEIDFNLSDIQKED